jgi:RNA polymerase sigma-70 factor (ECF subfamily)
MEVPDRELMDRYAHGDTRAFEELFQRYEGRAYGYFLRRSRSSDRARDLYQELFLRLHRFRERFDPRQEFAPWFFQIARRVWLDELRRVHRESLSDQPASEFADEPVAERWLSAREEVGELLATLPAAHAQVAVATKLGGAGYAELSRQLGKSEAALKQVGARALRKLRAAKVRAL